MWHCDQFTSEATEKGRSSVREDDSPRVTEAIDCLLVYAACEKTDETAVSNVAKKGAEEVATHAHHLKVNSVVLHSFAHLFVELSSPTFALNTLKAMELQLAERGFKVTRTPFGWFHELLIKAKGHPLSRVARQI